MTGLLLSLAILHGCDAATSTIGFQRGAREMNPIAGFDARSVVGSRAVLAAIEIGTLHELAKTHPTAARRLAYVAIGVSATAVGRNIHVLFTVHP